MARLRSRPDVELWEDEIYTVSHEGCGEYEVPMSCATATHEIYCPSCEKEAGSAEPTGKSAWWYWYCLPGCMPDSSPYGPFETEKAAEEEIEEENPDDEDDEEEGDDVED